MSARSLFSLLAALLTIAGFAALPSASLADDSGTDDACTAVVDDSGADWGTDDSTDATDDTSADDWTVDDQATDDSSADDQATDDSSADDTSADDQGDDSGTDDQGDDTSSDDWMDDPCWDSLTDDEVLGDAPATTLTTSTSAGSLAQTLTQTITMPGSGTIDATLTRGSATRSLRARGAVLGSQHVDVTKPGAVTLRLKLTKQGNKLLRTTRRALHLSLSVDVELDNGRTITRTAPLTIKPRPAKHKRAVRKPHLRKLRKH